ncbi:Glucose dehydrogenase/choline dehydrogenase/mandelonitrile lyase (GMC oxidoreductase family) [Ceraceosorus bombacis]|uniref:Glucose dehydrogenase/choline dehydrogenase/mandelonitrile lyase (GMC oxidoreductase family) n=1 Tax=Ceraceosorus bombacis TaxID=401625 RepID=A0A0P1BC23_9BASI|nr:Glucose dehydrogenase/choline dehydrogenase/mandelonitrile lyase (GMC oxidoreductase family) [Ceraceosorus bombacis]
MEDATTKKLTVRASKEVILSAGTIKTPQLLELSGIGRKEVLEKAGIKQRVDLPGVGENLSEHIYLGCAYEVQDGTVTWDKMRDAEFAAQQMQLYTGKGPDKGLIGSFVSGFAYFNLQNYLSPEDQKLVHQQIDETDQTGWSSGMKELHALQKKRYDDQTVPAMEQMFAPGFFAHSGPPKEDKSYFTLLSALQHPWSRGSIHVKSSDPFAHPDVDPRYFSSKADLTILSKALAWNDKVVSQEPLKEVVNVRQEPKPELVNEKHEDWENAVKGSFQTTYHHLGTASMMPREKVSGASFRLGAVSIP